VEEYLLLLLGPFTQTA